MSKFSYLKQNCILNVITPLPGINRILKLERALEILLFNDLILKLRPKILNVQAVNCITKIKVYDS
jgi:hypothetical protein